RAKAGRLTASGSFSPERSPHSAEGFEELRDGHRFDGRVLDAVEGAKALERLRVVVGDDGVDAPAAHLDTKRVEVIQLGAEDGPRFGHAVDVADAAQAAVEVGDGRVVDQAAVPKDSDVRGHLLEAGRHAGDDESGGALRDGGGLALRPEDEE